MYNANQLAFKTIGGDWVYPSEKEVDRIMRENAKAVKKMAPKDVMGYWAKIASKRAKKGAN